MAAAAKGDEVLLGIRTDLAAVHDVVDVEVLSLSTLLTAPAVPLEDFPAKPIMALLVFSQTAHRGSLRVGSSRGS
jgi:hypothetical protein